MSRSAADEIAATAARMVVEEGLEYGPAKRRAAKALGLTGRSATLPDNDRVEDAVREYLDLFCADTQPAELAHLRETAAEWMLRLAAFRPHLTGAVWRGTATRLSSVHIQLFCDDSKEAEVGLINLGVSYDVGSVPGPRGELVDVLRITRPNLELKTHVVIDLTVLDHDDLRGALKPDARGRSPRGDLAALLKLMESP
jgi:hypothetical protein